MNKPMLEEFRRLAGLRTEATASDFGDEVSFDHIAGGIKVNLGYGNKPETWGISLRMYSGGQGKTPMYEFPATTDRQDYANAQRLTIEIGKALHPVMERFEREIQAIAAGLVKKHQ